MWSLLNFRTTEAPSSVSSELSANVTAVFSQWGAFAALKEEARLLPGALSGGATLAG